MDLQETALIDGSWCPVLNCPCVRVWPTRLVCYDHQHSQLELWTRNLFVPHGCHSMPQQSLSTSPSSACASPFPQRPQHCFLPTLFCMGVDQKSKCHTCGENKTEGRHGLVANTTTQTQLLSQVLCRPQKLLQWVSSCRRSFLCLF